MQYTKDNTGMYSLKKRTSTNEELEHLATLQKVRHYLATLFKLITSFSYQDLFTILVFNIYYY